MYLHEKDRELLIEALSFYIVRKPNKTPKIQNIITKLIEDFKRMDNRGN